MDLQDIRRQLEGFKRVTAISDVIETERPEFAAKLLPPREAPQRRDPRADVARRALGSWPGGVGPTARP
jgi:hypothetical protein